MSQLSLERTGRITGSRIAGLLNLSPYRTRSQVLREMVREHFWAESEFDGNFVTDWGKEHEADGIAEYELLRGVFVENKGADQLTVVHSTLPIAVTPDGWVENGMHGPIEEQTEAPGLNETKCPYRGLYSNWKERPDYEAQMRWQCFTAEREWCDFTVWRYEGTAISRMFLDRDREGEPIDWMPQVWPEVEQFLEEYNAAIESEVAAEVHLTPILDQRVDDEWLAAVAAYFDLLYEQQRAARELNEVKEILGRLAGGKTTKGGGLQVIYRKGSPGGQGAISYKSALEALVPEEARPPKVLDRYRGKAGAGSAPSYAFKNILDKES